MAATDTLPLGIVLERREMNNHWQDHCWLPAAVIPGAAAVTEWRQLRRGEGWIHYHAGTLDLDLFEKETEGYKVNLSQPQPKVFVVLHPDDEGEREVVPFLVTACPYEAEGYSESGDEIVEGVPMPDDVIAWVQAFIDAYHVDVPFEKRKLKKHVSERKRTDGNG
ncbi:MAG: DUF3305 domain-containing protein [Rhodospirillales bacterium]